MTGRPGSGPGDPYGLHHLPYGTVQDATGRVAAAVRVGDSVLDLTRLTQGTERAPLFADGYLDAFLRAGAATWSAVREFVRERLTDPAAEPAVRPLLMPLDGVTPLLPFTVADYVDFYASEHHATNVGRIFRPGGDPLTANWRHLPIGYHGRAGTVGIPGGTVQRPNGQFRDAEGTICFGPSRRLDFEAELGVVIGAGSQPGYPVPTTAFAEQVFGVCLLNDWSARDIQSWEYVPLGPFLGKSFATTISAWITPLAALDGLWCSPPPRDPQPLPYLDDSASPAGLNLTLEVEVNGLIVSRPPFASMYWTLPQMIAHTTVNGAHLRSGDLLGSGTVSGPEADQRGSMLELSWGGEQPIAMSDGTTRAFLLDGDEVVLRATGPGVHGPIALGEVRCRIAAAQDSAERAGLGSATHE